MVSELVAAYVPAVSDLDCFRNFELDMTESFYLRQGDDKYLCDNMGRVERVRVMERKPGQKTSERMLWAIGPVAPERAAAAAARERQVELDRLAAAYANDPNFELEVDVTTFATGLAHAYRHHTGEMPMFLLDDNGEY